MCCVVLQTLLSHPHQTCRPEAPRDRASVRHHRGQDAGQCHHRGVSQKVVGVFGRVVDA